MKIKILKDVYVFKKKHEYDIVDECDKNYFVLTDRDNVIKFEKSEQNKIYKVIK